jgi:hypothetical protein
MTVNKAMTDIEKWTFKVKAIKIVLYSLTLVGCTWKLSAEFQALRAEIAANTAFLSEQKSINGSVDFRLTKLENNRSPTGHAFDSLSFKVQAIESRYPALRKGFYTQRRVNGKLYEFPVN